MGKVLAGMIAAAVLGMSTAAWADCVARLDEARVAVKKAEAAIDKAKETGKNAAKGPLGKAKKTILHAEAECKTSKDVKKQAEAAREAREAQGFAEEAATLAEKL
jgi:hypothetical protein